MKQHITLSQLQDLIDSNFNIFEKLVKIIYKDIGHNDAIWIEGGYIHTYDFYTAKGNIMHMLTIGRMIDILKGINKMVNIYNDEDENGEYGWWCVDVGDFNMCKNYKSKELHSALWDAVKYALGENNA